MSRIDIIEYGADPAGKSLNTTIIQQALDSCVANGGGTVYFPAGRYLTGTVIVGSNTTLEFANGATLLGSRDIADYDNETGTFIDACGARRGKGLIIAYQAKNVMFCGPGTIDGQGDIFPDLSYRPMLVRFVECKNVIVKDLTLRNSGAWVQHYFKCEHVRLSGVRVHSYSNANNDGLDIDCSAHVTVSDCQFECGDDAVTLKTTADFPCHDIAVTNCTISSRCNAIKFGTESIGDCWNVAISNCTINDTKLSGITLAAVDGANLRNVIISNVTMNNVGTALFIRLGNRRYNDTASGKSAGSIENVLIQNIMANNVGPTGSAIMGLPETPIKDVILKNIFVRTEGGCAEAIEQPLPELPDCYPEFNKWGSYPAYGLYCRHVRDLILEDVNYQATNNDSRPEILLDDVSQ